MQTADQLTLIYKKYLLGTCSEEELQLLLNHFEANGELSPLMPLIAEELSKEEGDAEPDASIAGLIERVDLRILYELQNRRGKGNPFFRLYQYRWAAIAATITIIAGLYFYNRDDQGQQSIYVNDIAPAKNSATLRLANGKVISLSESKTGVVIDAAKISYNDGEPLAGDGNAQERGRSGKPELATIIVPLGGIYQVMLQDGSRVWLNSGTELIFPTSFSGLANRNVSLKGEAYFEVAKDKQHPFIVQSGVQQVQVLGTHFNISSYVDDVELKTTLLEGSVCVTDSRTHLSGLLKPGEQLSINRSGTLNIAAADLRNALAWKDGYFIFSNESLPDIMKELSRWYNIEVVYHGNITKEHFYAKISRKSNISQVLDALQSTKAIRFKVEGRRVTIIE